MNPIQTHRTIMIDGKAVETQPYCHCMEYVNNNDPDTVYCLTCKEYTLLVPGINWDTERPYRCRNDKNTDTGFYSGKHDVVVFCPKHKMFEEIK